IPRRCLKPLHRQRPKGQPQGAPQDPELKSSQPVFQKVFQPEIKTDFYQLFQYIIQSFQITPAHQKYKRPLQTSSLSLKIE
ncbi:hypothetical protein, partial [Pseudomonas sp. NBRC 111117]|uniref:hypothetical protein n=1 Tax=Pseudomonas sp. NBRC 111117 TaxID=1661032 RepID=UPI001C45DACE